MAFHLFVVNKSFVNKICRNVLKNILKTSKNDFTLALGVPD